MEKAFFRFGHDLSIAADSRLDNAVIRELWNGFCLQNGQLHMEKGEACEFKTSGMPSPMLPGGCEYAIIVAEQGFAAVATDYPALARAMMVLVQRIEAVSLEPVREAFQIETCQLEGRYKIKTRMIHFCVFPETTLVFLKKCIRLAGVMQYTHVVLEFWGMLQYDALKELAWQNAYTKEQIRPLIREIEDLGMEAVPMLNHLGHASASRVSSGKHVVLDQNPRLAPLFSNDGWSWNIASEQARSLLKDLRAELGELFPSSSYIHLGCDEVYSYENSDEQYRLMCGYMRDLLQQVKGEGKRPIIWGDMLLNEKACGVTSPYFCGCHTPENAERIMASIPKDTIIADWHYDVTEVPIQTSVYLKERGFDVLGAPWYRYDNCQAYVDTIYENRLMGVMVTTWHTLAQKMPHIVEDALMCGAYTSPWITAHSHQVLPQTATLLRAIHFSNGHYNEAGWTDLQVSTVYPEV